MAEPAPYVIEEGSEKVFDTPTASPNEPEDSAEVLTASKRGSFQINNSLTAVPKRSLLASFTLRRTNPKRVTELPKESTSDLFLVEDLLPTITDQHVGDSASAGMGSEALFLWLRRADRKFKEGTPVFRINKNGKLARRRLFVGKEPEMIEITSATALESTSHLSLISQVLPGRNSEEFRAYESRMAEGKRETVVGSSRCVVVSFVNSGDMWSLVFQNEADFRDFQWLLRIERRAIRERISAIDQDYTTRLRSAGLTC